MEYPSFTEKFLAVYVAPELLSENGRISVLAIWTILTVVALLGIPFLSIEFDINFFISEDKYAFQYFDLMDKYFDQGFTIEFFVENSELDYASVEQ